MKFEKHFNPSHTYIQPNFQELLQNFFPIKNIGQVPTIGGKKTYFWSIEKYTKISQQYIIDPHHKSPTNNYFFLEPDTYKNRQTRYHQKFRNQVRKGYRNGLTTEIISDPSRKIGEKIYAIFHQNMSQKHAFVFERDFFDLVIKLENSSTFLVKQKDKILSFAIIIDNHLFIQSSTRKGKQMLANNVLYDQLFQNFEHEYIYLGTAHKGHNPGLYRFKQRAGALSIPCGPTKYVGHYKIFYAITHCSPIKKILLKLPSKWKLKQALPY